LLERFSSSGKVIDIGANLTHKSFDHDLDDVIKRSLDAGVEKIIVTASSISESKRVAAMIKQYSGILWGTSGVHPHHAKEADDLFAETLDELIQNENIVAVGECGLDYFRNFSEPREQQKVFRIQLQIALKILSPFFSIKEMHIMTLLAF
jgi:TatD DNase family protein